MIDRRSVRIAAWSGVLSAFTMLGLGQEVVVLSETRQGGVGRSMYQELRGNWRDSTAKAVAEGLTDGIGSRCVDIRTSEDGAIARWTLAPPEEGLYEAQVIWSSSGNAIDVVYRISNSHESEHVISQDGRGYLGPRNGDQWISLGIFEASSSHPLTIEVSDEQVSGQPDQASPGRVYADAVRLIRAPEDATLETAMAMAPAPAEQTEEAGTLSSDFTEAEAVTEIEVAEEETLPAEEEMIEEAVEEELAEEVEAAEEIALPELTMEGPAAPEDAVLADEFAVLPELTTEGPAAPEDAELAEQFVVAEVTESAPLIEQVPMTESGDVVVVESMTETTIVEELAIAWSDSFDSAVTLARTANRPILTAFITERSRDSREMEAMTWRDPNVIAAVSERFVPVRVNMREAQQLCADLGIYRSPTTVVLIPGMERPQILMRHVGFLGPEEMVTQLESIQIEE